MKVFYLLATFMLFVGAPANAQDAHKQAVVFNCNCSNMASSLYATAFRDLIAESPRYRLIRAGSEETVVKPGRTMPWVINAVSIDSSAAKDGSDAAISVAFTVSDLLVDNAVQLCGKDAAKECAEQTLATLDQDIHALVK